MIGTLASILSLVVLAAPPSPPTLREQLRGTWRIVSYELEGNRLTISDGKTFRVVWERVPQG